MKLENPPKPLLPGLHVHRGVHRLARSFSSVLACTARRVSTRPSVGQGAGMHAVLRIVSYAVVLLMVVAIGYAGWISIKYWNLVGV